MKRDERLPRQAGFTLIELLAAMGIVAILMTFAAGALRQYWLVAALRGSREEVVSQLRRQQEQSVSESHPLAYGARFRASSNAWDLVVFNAGSSTTSSDDTCRAINRAGTRVTSIGHRALSTGVRVQSVTFAVAPGVTAVCRSQLSGAGSDEFVFFFARGTATQGSMTFSHGSLPGRSLGLTVSPITGRVEVTG